MLMIMICILETDLKANHFYFGLNKHTLKGHNQTHPEIDIQNHYPDIEELLKRSIRYVVVLIMITY